MSLEFSPKNESFDWQASSFRKNTEISFTIIDDDEESSTSCYLAKRLFIEDLSALKVFPRGIGSLFTSIEELWLINCGLREISRDDFEDLKGLKRLHLFNNRIKSLPVDVFSCLTHLEELDLSGNFLEFIDPATFDPLKKLENLDLRSNKAIGGNWKFLSRNPERRRDMKRRLLKVFKRQGRVKTWVKRDDGKKNLIKKKNKDKLVTNDEKLMKSLMTLKVEFKAYCKRMKEFEKLLEDSE